MGLTTEFTKIEVGDITALASSLKRDGYRFVQMLCVATEAGLDVIYSFNKGPVLQNYTVEGLTPGTKVPSITGEFLEAFVFENESHDLFGLEVEGIAIDFGGKFYHVAQSSPMTVISPAQLAAREKAAKVEAAKKAQAEKKSAAKDTEAKIADLDPEKAAKVKRALEAKAARQAAGAAPEAADAAPAPVKTDTEEGE